MAEPSSDIVGIFPTPVLIARGMIPKDLVEALIAQFESSDTGANVRTTTLSHTPMTNPRSNQNYMAVLKHLGPKLRSYGEALMGEALDWGVKEIWINKMETGGAQKMHNHANSFISGVIYLSEVDPSAATVFYRNVSPSTFVMQNENRNCKIGPFNTPIFRTPPVEPGDAILFPSYVMHEVPPNAGGTRYTAAFNALPARLDSWGYTVQFR